MASCSSVLPLLRQAAPRLSKRFFSGFERCPRRLIHHPSRATPQAGFRSTRQTPFLKAFRSQSTTSSSGNSSGLIASIRRQANEDAQKIAQKWQSSAAEGGSSFPKVADKSVAYWLLGSAASVFGIVVFGGLTRLTESGLSITEWRPVTGSLPPLSSDHWASEFDKYKLSPEAQKLNSGMTLAEFKKIYWMEWTHRLWGRVVGLTFLVPTVYFIARRRVSPQIARNLIIINGLIVSQGFVGWWMVKSGLKDDLFAPEAHPRVSQYRLAVHLGLAFTVYSAMLWNALQILRERRLVLDVPPGRAAHLLARLTSPTLGTFRGSLAATTGLVFVTAMAGALVAGLDAGLIYNEWPRMGLGLTPPRAELWSDFYSRRADRSDLWWRNLLENPSLVQLDHRLLAYSTFAAVHALFLYSRFALGPRGGRLPRGAHKAMHGVLGFVWLQASLGLATLLYLVPTPLAAAHQAGSLALLTWCVVAGSRVWTSPRLARLVAERVKVAAAAAAGGKGQVKGSGGKHAAASAVRSRSAVAMSAGAGAA